MRRRLIKVLLLILVTWFPLVILSFVEGNAWGYSVAEPLLLDPVVYSRFLFVVPLLEIAQVIIEASLGVQMRHFVDSGLIIKTDLPEFESARDAVVHLRGSVVVEAFILILAFTACVLIRGMIAQGPSGSSWERVRNTITLAGWWYILVSLPILLFFLLRWFWIFALWGWFLFRISRLDLELTPTHPDRAGGLGFLGWGLASFSLILMAISAVMSGGFAREIIHRGASLNDLKYHVIVFVALAVVLVHVPLLAFAGKQARCRFQGLLDFGALIWRHDRAFDEKWIKTLNTTENSILGCADASSLADIAASFEHVDRMQLIPLDKKALFVLIAATLIPMVPLVGTTIPLTEILSKLGEFLI
jgi:hypothetical protein